MHASSGPTCGQQSRWVETPALTRSRAHPRGLLLWQSVTLEPGVSRERQHIAKSPDLGVERTSSQGNATRGRRNMWWREEQRSMLIPSITCEGGLDSKVKLLTFLDMLCFGAARKLLSSQVL